MKTKKKIEKVEGNNFLQELYREYINEPTIRYKVGDLVLYGNHPNAEVIEVLGDGKIYQLKLWGTYYSYGQPYEGESTQYVKWTDIKPFRTYEENLLIPVLTKEDDLRLNFSQRTMGDILSKYYHFGINMSPDYQRGNVWGLSDKEKLLNSIFDNIDIGKFVFIKLPYAFEGKLFEILDGKQRVTAIIDFFENRYSYNGRYYKDLSWKDQGHFEHYNINIAETDIEELSKKKIYKYFLRLNISGHEQDKEHIAYVQKLYEECKE
jgi:hypothetical protein